MKGRKVFVAGGAGLIGANLVRRLTADGAIVSASYHTRKPTDGGEGYIRFDLTRFEDCLEATKGMDCVFLAAARRFGGKVMRRNPTEFLLPNLQIQAGLLEACQRNNVPRVALISSSTVYQDSAKPLREDDLDLNAPMYEPMRGVGWLNRYVEQLALHQMQVHPMKVWIVRPPNVFGPHDDFDAETANVLPALIARALAKEDPFVVWGDGKTVRDFLYVDDFVEDLLAWMEKGPAGEPVNIGSGVATTVREAVDVVLKACGYAASPRYDAGKPTGIAYRVLDGGRLEGRLGRRKRTSLGDAVAKTAEWYNKRGKT